MIGVCAMCSRKNRESDVIGRTVRRGVGMGVGEWRLDLGFAPEPAKQQLAHDDEQGNRDHDRRS